MKGNARLKYPLDATDVRVINEFMDDVYVGVEDQNNRKVADNKGISVKKLRRHDLGERTLTGTPSEDVIPHNLDVTPEFIIITMRSAWTAWESKRSDSSRIYITASAGATAHIIVFA